MGGWGGRNLEVWFTLRSETAREVAQSQSSASFLSARVVRALSPLKQPTDTMALACDGALEPLAALAVSSAS